MAMASKEASLLFHLISIPSISGHEGKACSYLASQLPSLGWDDTYIDEAGNVVASRGNGKNEIVLLGHIDTVKGGPEVKMGDDFIWGRGAVDAKGPLCAMAVAGGRAKLDPGFKLTLIAAVGEESSSKGTLYRIPLHSPKACIVGEPSNTYGITIGYRGCLKATIKAQDNGAHRSADEGPLTHVTLAAADILNFIRQESEALQQAVIFRPSGAIISMSGREMGRRTAEIEMEIRIPVGSTPEQYTSLIEKCTRKHGVEFEIIFAIKPHLVDKDNLVVRALRKAVRNHYGTPQLFVKSGTADFNHAAAWNCPLAAYGPGDSSLDHGMEEHVSVKDYLKSIDILEAAVCSIMSYDLA